MCGRYVAVHSPRELAKEFDVVRITVEGPAEPDYNVAPTKPVPAVLTRERRAETDEEGGEGARVPERQLRMLRWGLVPSWAKDPAIGNRLINARVETAPDKPSFRKAFAKRRCILPALGFYEWEQVGATDAPDKGGSGGGKPYKQPYFIHRPDDATLAMAGLYELWRDPDREREDPDAWLWSATVLTTQATDEAGRIHDRAPLLVPAAAYEAWLAPDLPEDDTDLRALLVPATTGMRADPVSTAVNNVRNNGPQLIEPALDVPDQPRELR